MEGRCYSPRPRAVTTSPPLLRACLAAKTARQAACQGVEGVQRAPQSAGPTACRCGRFAGPVDPSRGGGPYRVVLQEPPDEDAGEPTLQELRQHTPEQRIENRIKKYGKMGFWDEVPA